MHPFIIPTLIITRVASYLVLMTILVLAFEFDVDFIVRYWPALLCGGLALSTACDTSLGLPSGTLHVASVTMRRATQPRLFVVMVGG